VDFAALAGTERDAFERRASELVDALSAHHAGMHEAVRYALLGGGKRLRAIACLWSHDLVGGSVRDAALDAGVAIECLHAYSLVHDDLPCMDDDELRRGRPTVHVRFGEATAVLTGDALLTLSFDILSGLTRRHAAVGAATTLEAVSTLAAAAGTGGLIVGQALDLAAEGREGGESEVERIHTLKTARLIAASMEMGAILGGAERADRDRIRDAGLLAGRAFQIVDDLLDLAGDKETLGKTPGKDVNKKKLTYPAVLGVERSRAVARELVERAKERLRGVRGQADALCAMIDFIADRAA